MNDAVGYSILKLQGAAVIEEQCLKEGGACFKLRGIIHIRFQNFFSFHIAINNYQWITVNNK